MDLGQPISGETRQRTHNKSDFTFPNPQMTERIPGWFQ